MGARVARASVRSLRVALPPVLHGDHVITNDDAPVKSLPPPAATDAALGAAQPATQLRILCRTPAPLCAAAAAAVGAAIAGVADVHGAVVAHAFVGLSEPLGAAAQVRKSEIGFSCECAGALWGHCGYSTGVHRPACLGPSGAVG